MLEDEESRSIYLNRLSYLISGDLNYIDAIVATYLPGVPISNRKPFASLRDTIPQDRKVVLYGAGTMGKKILSCWEKDERLIGFCSQTKEKQKNGYCGWPVMSPEELLSRKDCNVVISTTRSHEEILQILKAGGYPQDQIYNLLEYKYEDPGQYFAPKFMRYGDREILIDAGCCDLNSCRQFKKYCKHVKKIYAFEPDPKCYQVCLERKTREAFSEVELLPYGVWSKQTALSFEATSDGISHICEEGKTRIRAVSIDETINSADKITMIKMDIEGSELEALKGAKKTILRDKPKLAICIYHKPEDMIEIPLYIKRLVPEYRLYVRHHSNSASETVLYAVMPE